MLLLVFEEEVDLAICKHLFPSLLFPRRLSRAVSLIKTMTIPIYIAGVAVLGYFLWKVLYGTDTPHIKGLPEVPGLPLFGSLYELGTNHAKVAQGWAKKYGPVFQVRMGNRVSTSSLH